MSIAASGFIAQADQSGRVAETLATGYRINVADSLALQQKVVSGVSL